MSARATGLLVVGGGPGGYVAAIRAAQLGVPTTLVEAGAVGGTCLNIGCIPSKALIHVANRFADAVRDASGGDIGIDLAAPRIDIVRSVKWKDGIVARLTGGVAALLRRAGVAVVAGHARILDGKRVEVTPSGGGEPMRIDCEHLLLATGSGAVGLPGIPFGGPVMSATDALSPSRLPTRLVVAGAGYIGLELGIAYRKLGVDVVVVEIADRILPGYDAALAAPVAASMRRLGIDLRLGCRIESLEPAVRGTDGAAGAAAARGAVGHGIVGEPVSIGVRDATGRLDRIDAERLLVAIGRRARSDGMNLESLGLAMRGHAVVVDDRCGTSMRNVWAIGDLTGEPMLAHRAMAQAEVVAENVAGRRRHFCPAAIAAVCFTDPEVVSVGASPGDPASPTARDDALLEGRFPFSANGRAMTLDSTEGFVRVVARRADHRIVGWQAVGAGVSELAAAFAQSIEMHARLEDVAATIHPHPTLGEAVQEAAMRALGRALHV
ncbi:MAG: FAD-dependent oxidoreductase [Lautropia sp.]